MRIIDRTELNGSIENEEDKFEDDVDLENMKMVPSFRIEKKVILDPKYHIIIIYFLSLTNYLPVIYV